MICPKKLAGNVVQKQNQEKRALTLKLLCSDKKCGLSQFEDVLVLFIIHVSSVYYSC